MMQDEARDYEEAMFDVVSCLISEDWGWAWHVCFGDAFYGSSTFILQINCWICCHVAIFDALLWIMLLVLNFRQHFTSSNWDSNSRKRAAAATRGINDSSNFDFRQQHPRHRQHHQSQHTTKLTAKFSTCTAAATTMTTAAACHINGNNKLDTRQQQLHAAVTTTATSIHAVAATIKHQ